MTKRKRLILWILRILLSIGFLFASSGKLTQNEYVIIMFRDWGYSDGFYMIIGILELVLAIMILIPKSSLYAAIGLMFIMIGAMITHMIHDPLLEIIRPLVFMILLGFSIYLQVYSIKKIVDKSE